MNANEATEFIQQQVDLLTDRRVMKNNCAAAIKRYEQLLEAYPEVEFYVERLKDERALYKRIEDTVLGLEDLVPRLKDSFEHQFGFTFI